MEKEIVFHFRNEDYKLSEILEEGDLFPLTDAREKEVGKIITRAGIGRLIDKLEGIQLDFGQIQSFVLSGKNQIAIEACASDLTNAGSRVGRAFGEASTKNCAGIAEMYPVAMAEKRAKARAVLDLLGIRNVYSEDEAKEFKDVVLNRDKAQRPKETRQEKEEKDSVQTVIAEINEYAAKLELSKEQKLDAYREVLGDKSLSFDEIKKQATSEIKVKVRDLLKERLAEK